MVEHSGFSASIVWTSTHQSRQAHIRVLYSQILPNPPQRAERRQLTSLISHGVRFTFHGGLSRVDDLLMCGGNMFGKEITALPEVCSSWQAKIRCRLAGQHTRVKTGLVHRSCCPLMNFRTSALTTTPLALQMHTTYRADKLLQSRTQFHGGYHLQDSETIKSIPLRTSKAQLEDLVLNVRHICERFFWQKYVTVHEVYRTHEVP